MYISDKLELKLSMCRHMSKTKDNRQIAGTSPSSEFKRIGDKIVQSPPSTQILQHLSDRYTYTQLRDFITALLPNFYQSLNNEDEYLDFLQPNYSPKILAFIREDQQMPAVLKKIATAYFLRFDFGYITDLNEQLLKLFQVKKFPTLLIMKYNFNTTKHQYYYYSDNQFGEQSYHNIKKFVDKYALTERRNDLVLHKIEMQEQSQIITVQTQGQLQEVKEKASGWLIIMRGDGKIPQKLAQFKQKYDRYFSYVNYVQEPYSKIQIYNPSQRLAIPYQDELKFNTLNFQYFKTNLSSWINKDVVVLGIAEDFGHVCGLAEKTMFRGHVRCLIIQKDGQAQLKQHMKIDFKVGFIIRSDGTENQQSASGSNRQTKGVRLMEDNFEQIYYELDLLMRHKIKDILEDYLKRPISQVKYQMSLLQACNHPFKKCVLLVTNLGKQDRTLQQYLKQIAFDYIDHYILYEVDIDKNPDLIKAIGGIKDKKADLIVFSPRNGEFSKLNKKITKNLIVQFLKANLRNDKRLKKQKIQKPEDIFIKRRLSIQKTHGQDNQQNQQL